MIIDFHTHVFSPGIIENRNTYIDSDPCFAELYSDEKAKLVTADDLIESMDNEEIDISVILNIGWTSQEICIETNDYIMESVSRYPKRLIGFGSISLQTSDSALQEVERCQKGRLKGIGEMRAEVQVLDMNDSNLFDQLAQTLIENDMIYLTHASEPVGHQYQGKGNITPNTLYPFFSKHPDLKIVCAHWGGGLPFYALMPEVKREMRNVYFDTAASPYLYLPQIYTHVIDLVGPDKILFGTDYPLLKPSRLLKEIDRLDLPRETRKMILEDNARNLLMI